jgi:hypothetical protein
MDLSHCPKKRRGGPGAKRGRPREAVEMTTPFRFAAFHLVGETMGQEVSWP